MDVSRVGQFDVLYCTSLHMLNMLDSLINNKEASWLQAELFFVLVSMFFPGHHMVSAWKAHGVHI